MKKYLYKNPGLFILIHLFMIILVISFFVLFIEKQINIFLIIAVTLLCLMTVSVIYSFFSWNVKIYFDYNEIYYYRKGTKLAWKWNEITKLEIKERFLAWGNPLSYYLEITTSDSYKKLIFEYSASREKFLVSICPLEKLKEMFEELLNN